MEPEKLSDAKTLKDRAFEWLFQQGTSTVLLVAILSTIAWFARWELHEGTPARVKLIQEGYDRQNVVHERIEKAQRESFKEALEIVITSKTKGNGS